MRVVPENLYVDDKGTGVREFRVMRIDRYQVTDWESFNQANGKSQVRVIGDNLTLAQANEMAAMYGAAYAGSLVNGIDDTPKAERSAVTVELDASYLKEVLVKLLHEFDIEALVSRFLAWPLPTSVRPDGIDGDPHRSGTNLLTADEARQMLKYLLHDPIKAAIPE